MIDAKRVRKDFPIFAENPGLVYLDSAATSQRPSCVIDAVSGFYRGYNSNVARGLYRIAEKATLAYEEAREKAQSFIGAGESREIIFTKNTTESANLLMRAWGEKSIRKGDVIVTTQMEHHSNLVPWQQLAKRRGARLEIARIQDDGTLDLADLDRKLRGARLFAYCAASNVLGTLNDARALCRMAGSAGAISVVDGAQSVPSMPTDVKKLGCDFLMFSGHKMLAPFGSGVLYGRAELLESMDPFLYGSAMMRMVDELDAQWNEIPHRFEAGTPLVDAAIGLSSAIAYLESKGMEKIRSHDVSLTSYMLKRLAEVPGLRILGPPDAKKRVGIAAFTMEGIHPHDVSAMLSEDDVCVRSGHHCAMPLHTRLGIPASTRASVYLYNEAGDIDSLIDSLMKARKVFK